MALLGELRIVQRLVGLLEIAAAILPIRIQKQRVETFVEIIVMSDIASRPRPRIELCDPPPGEAP